jgi:hypothetical protein
MALNSPIGQILAFASGAKDEIYVEMQATKVEAKTQATPGFFLTSTFASALILTYCSYLNLNLKLYLSLLLKSKSYGLRRFQIKA